MHLRPAKVAKVAAVNVAVFLVLLGICEAVGQIVAIRNPSYQVLFLQPDPVTGWKHVPEFSWNWTGHYWYAADFTVPVRSNRLGFRDRRYVLDAPPGVSRVGLLGNSFIEALQVPDEKTADFVLERRLNASAASGRSWEVLNFAISNYSVGQYLLTWQEYVRQYDPDFVAVFVAFFHMKRSVRKYTAGAFRYSEDTELWVRPIFSIDENDSLVMIPAADFEEFDSLQQEVINKEFGGSRVRVRRSIVTLEYMEQLLNRFNGFADRISGSVEDSVDDPHEDDVVVEDDTISAGEILELNLRILSEMGRQIRSAGSKMVILDASRYFGDEPLITDSLKALSDRHGFGYLPVYAGLLEAESRGHDTRWEHDGHFNELGNQIVANALYDWLARHAVREERDSTTAFGGVGIPTRTGLH